MEPTRRSISEQTAGGGSAAAYEFVLSPVLLALLGLWLDRSVLDTTPYLTVTFAVLGLVGATVKLYYGYRHRMAALAADAPWARRTEAVEP